jgi:hypothetical protein
MGFYGERVLPRILSAACGTKTVEPLRRRVCGAWRGTWSSGSAAGNGASTRWSSG